MSVSARMESLIADAAAQVGVSYRITQGSYSDSVGASAGTHAGGGAADLSTRGYSREQALALVTELRKRNGCAWLRTAEFGWSGTEHIHVIVRDEPDLSPAAQRQVADYDRGLNGLASQGRDPFPRPPQHPYDPGGTPSPQPTPEDDMKALIVEDGTGGIWVVAADLSSKMPLGDRWSLPRLEATGLYVRCELDGDTFKAIPDARG